MAFFGSPVRFSSIAVTLAVVYPHRRLLPAKVTGAADHLKLKVGLGPSADLQRSGFAEAMFWRHGHLLPEIEGHAAVDLCYRLEIDTYWGDERLRLNIQELRGSDATP